MSLLRGTFEIIKDILNIDMEVKKVALKCYYGRWLNVENAWNEEGVTSH